ncbi:glycosyltransferase family 2 protein [Arthrobacter cavernae]|uniref:Glycosyltransferase family 2 protein n=1 Tax=Arthrobacter cavernae TaxID=2817681 RepID=A0A939KL73_9MICC|nr:glycosyltransferase family 2 protein [Arthrobacter cavernae]MBO1266851.1 glycosyltransferase family 2 protein [Arthrobacter cavernae]
MTDLVAAVVVTYNRVDKLGRVLDSILAQTRAVDQLIVIDNASSDSTPELLASYGDDPRVEVVRLETNTGGAGGFAAGMEKAYERGADWVWIMDDDCYTGETALEKLLDGHTAAEKELDRKVPYSCSLVRYTDGSICEMNNPGTTWDWGRLIAKGQNTVVITNCSFVSVLIPRRSIARYGLPLVEYFIWFDDMEYTLRISADGPGVQILDSVVTHDMPDNRGVNFGDLNSSNAWKFYYGARNESSYRWHHDNKLDWLKFVLGTYVWMRRGRVSRRLQLGVAKRILAGLKFNPVPKQVRSVR